ncbi:MAG: hypothetical protein RI601_07115 [Desulfurivibrionaceae bacterium]|nr:hypothetical protein [Desulfurivibrionaceae bacterium]
MSPEHWHCWTITGCQKKNICPAGQQLEKECWEIVQAMEDFRSYMHVCQDCIVHLFKEKNSVLSETEMDEIMEKKGVCVLASKCVDEIMVKQGVCGLAARKEKV